MLRGLGIIAVAAATAMMLVAATPRLDAALATPGFLPPDDPDVVRDREVTEEFGFANPVVWVLEARHGDLWTPARLRRLAALTDDVLRIPGVVPTDVVGLASPNLRDLRVTDEGLETTYLMGDVPQRPEDVAALRRRIDDDPSYAGTLTTRDGRAAMVVANFRDDADAAEVGRAALAVRDRYRDDDTTAWTTGRAVVAVTAPAAAAAALPRAAGAAMLALVGFAAMVGLRAAGGALAAATLATGWTVAGVALVGTPMPWALEAVVAAALVGAAFAAGAASPIAYAATLAAATIAAAVAAGAPADRTWLASATAAPLAVAAGALVRDRSGKGGRPIAASRRARGAGVVVALAAVAGLSRLHLSLGQPGYGERYLPASAAADVVAVRRLFAPPTSLVFRMRGAPGFVADPDVLRALDAAAAVARRDPAVRSATSIADVVKTVNAAFGGGGREAYAVPDDRIVAGRYLSLAYSPPVRRFVDRAFAETALWVLVAGERPADVARVRSDVEATLRGRAIPGATLAPPTGDGVLLLRMAELARRIVWSAALALVVVTAGVAALRGRAAAGRAGGAGVVAAAVAGGILGWVWQAADLVSLPLVAVAAIATAILAGLDGGMRRFALGVGSAGLVIAAAGPPAGPLLAALLLGPAAGLLVCSRDASTPPRGRP